MTGSFADSWTDLVALLEATAPITARSLAPGASVAAIRKEAGQCPYPWPEDLMQYFAVQGGQIYASPVVEAGELIPHHELLSLRAAMDARSELLDALGDPDPEVGVAARDAEAQMPAERYLPGYIPIAEGDGHYLFCDTRPGVHRGAIGAFSADESDADTGWWPSVTDMIGDITTSLTTGSLLRFFRPYASDGVVRWSSRDDGAMYRARMDELHAHYLQYPDGYARPVEIEPTDGVDLMQFQRDALALAADDYGHENITQVIVAPRHLPRIVGYQAVCAVAIRGVLRSYTATVTDLDGSFRIDPPPYR